MSSIDVWLVLVTPSPGPAQATCTALAQLQLDHRLVRVADVRADLDREVPGAAIIQAARLQPTLLEVQRWLTEYGVPMLVLLEVLDEQREALLLGRGAQDVMEVPATSIRLRSRILALHRSGRSGARTNTPAETVIFVPPALTIYPERRVVMVGERHVHLTKSEFDLLVTLARVPNDVVPPQLLASILNQGDLSARALQSHVSRLRIKLRGAGAPCLLQAVRGVGYRLTRLEIAPPPPT